MRASTTRRGLVYGVLAAVTFGATAPVAGELVRHADPELLAGVLYLGALLGLSLAGSSRRRHEAPVGVGDLSKLGVVVAVGGVVAPVLLLLGLQRVGGLTGSLALNLEAPLTALVAVVWFGEHLSRRALLGGAVVVAGAVVLGGGSGHGSDVVGVVLVAAACACWAIDNNLTQGLTMRDPVTLVRVKATGAAVTNIVVALIRGATVPDAWIIAAALGLGAVGYGLSVLFDAYALRDLGAAREAAIFASAPFAGAFIAVVGFGEPVDATIGIAIAVMVLGLVLILGDRHAHLHEHAALTHEHRHVHDEHHDHSHPEGVAVREPHSHRHVHVPLRHVHPHVSDAHHRHTH